MRCLFLVGMFVRLSGWTMASTGTGPVVVFFLRVGMGSPRQSVRPVMKPSVYRLVRAVSNVEAAVVMSVIST